MSEAVSSINDHGDGLPIKSDRRQQPDDYKTRWANLCERFLPLRASGTPWRYSRRLTDKHPEYGWKIHLSATILNACDILQAAVPVLHDLGAPLKGPSTLDELRKINSGIWYGYSQVGKFVTVYPVDNSEFMQICRELDRICIHLGGGPVVPFDTRLHSNSNVYYRYGLFRQSESNSLTGSSFDKDRTKLATVVLGQNDPFDKEGLSKYRPVKDGIGLNTRYKIFRSISQRGKGGVYHAIDIGTVLPRQCVIKEGRKNGEVSWNGDDGYHRIEHEARVLSSCLSRRGIVPIVYDKFSVGNSFYLVLEKLEGVGLDLFLRQRKTPVSLSDRMDICKMLVELVAEIHQAGIVWRDCKPSNIFINKKGEIRAIDFEGACAIDEFDPFVWSTPNYSPPEISSGCYSAPRSSNLPEDLFALGCCLYEIVERKTPFPDKDFSAGPLLQHRIDKRVKSVIRSLLSEDPERRPRSEEVRDIFRSLR